MTTGSKNKLLMWAVVILLIANTATLAIFWLNRPPKRGGPPSEFLIKELGFDAKQKDQYLAMVQKHRTGADEIKKKIGAARDRFFHLLNQPNVNDSTKLSASKNVTDLIGQLDMMTFDHFKEVMKICTPEQEKKFEHIIGMMDGPLQHPGGPPGGPGATGGKPPGPPPGE